MKKLSDFEFAAYVKKAHQILDSINEKLEMAYQEHKRAEKKAA
ncbi:hypothetical protein [Halopseudomonas aestusnigri]|tara:strand:- start:15993 stop:16121 length:129 start_codon:yes stop_codon:yes gene_type:complete